MEIDKARPKFHLLDEDAELNTQQFQHQITNLTLRNAYGVLAVIGAQSTGKSTLLNALYNSSFQIQDKRKRIGQTTKGVWCQVLPADQLVILDVEGSDSFEQLDRNNIERRNALFALALSNLLLINIWFEQLGLHKGSQLSVLETIFQLNLKLFEQKQSLKRIVFVVRDCFEQQKEFASIKATLFKRVESVWERIVKPSDKADLKLETLFQLEAYFLPSKLQEPQEFIKKVEKLRGSLGEKILSTAKSGTNIAIQELPTFASNLWTVIRSNKDLNLPKEKILISNSRCRSIKAEIFESFSDSLLEIVERAKRIVMPNFGAETKKIVNQMLSQYQAKAANYLPEQIAEVETEFRGELSRQIEPGFLAQARMLSTRLTQQMISDLTTIVEECQTDRLPKLKPQITSQFIAQINPLAYDPCWIQTQVLAFQASLDQSLQAQIDSVVRDSMKALSEDLHKQANVIISNTFYHKEIFKHSFWDHLKTQYSQQSKMADSAARQMFDRLSRLQTRQLLSLPSFITSLHSQLAKDFITALQIRFVDLPQVLIKHFRSDFCNNPQGLPHQWTDFEPKQIEEDYVIGAQRAVGRQHSVMAGNALSNNPFLQSIKFHFILIL